MGANANFSLNDLEGKQVKVLPIVKSTWITDPEHEAAFLVGAATNNFSAPMDRNGNVVCPLSKDEVEFFETPGLSGMSYKTGDLSPYKEDNNFWKTHKVRLNKDPKVFNLSKPKDYIDYKILLANKDLIASSPEEAKRKRSYKYMIVSDDHEVDVRLTKQKKLQEAYMFFGKIEDNQEEMLNFLKIYGKKVPTAANIKWLKDEIGKVIIEDVEGFLGIARDSDRKTRLMILQAVEAGILVKEGRKFFLRGGEPLCNPSEVPLIDIAVKFLKEPKNQDIYIDIKNRLQTAKD